MKKIVEENDKLFNEEAEEFNFDMPSISKVERIYYSFLQWFKESFLMFFKVIYWKIRYGFDIRDTWSLDYAICKWLVPRLKYFRKHNNGFPVDTDLEGKNMTAERWDYYLSLIQYWAEKVANDEEPIYMPNYKGKQFPEWRSEENKIAKRTFDLGEKCFHRYFNHLWW